jgi:hypothetical protein
MEENTILNKFITQRLKKDIGFLEEKKEEFNSLISELIGNINKGTKYLNSEFTRLITFYQTLNSKILKLSEDNLTYKIGENEKIQIEKLLKFAGDFERESSSKDLFENSVKSFKNAKNYFKRVINMRLCKDKAEFNKLYPKSIRMILSSVKTGRKVISLKSNKKSIRKYQPLSTRNNKSKKMMIEDVEDSIDYMHEKTTKGQENKKLYIGKEKNEFCKNKKRPRSEDQEEKSIPHEEIIREKVPKPKRESSKPISLNPILHIVPYPKPLLIDSEVTELNNNLANDFDPVTLNYDEISFNYENSLKMFTDIYLTTPEMICFSFLRDKGNFADLLNTKIIYSCHFNYENNEPLRIIKKEIPSLIPDGSIIKFVRIIMEPLQNKSISSYSSKMEQFFDKYFKRTYQNKTISMKGVLNCHFQLLEKRFSKNIPCLKSVKIEVFLYLWDLFEGVDIRYDHKTISSQELDKNLNIWKKLHELRNIAAKLQKVKSLKEDINTIIKYSDN